MRCQVPCRGSAASWGRTPEARVRVAVRRALLREVRRRLRVAHGDAEPEGRAALEVPRPAGAVLLPLRRGVLGQLDVVEEVLTSGAGPVRGNCTVGSSCPVYAPLSPIEWYGSRHMNAFLAQGLAVAISLCDRRPGKGRQDHKGQRDDVFHPSSKDKCCFPCVADDRPTRHDASYLLRTLRGPPPHVDHRPLYPPCTRGATRICHTSVWDTALRWGSDSACLRRRLWG